MRRAGIRAEIVDAGCCGLAGNFGFARGPYELSRAIGEQGVLPAVREAADDALVLADGFSCRTQIDQGGTGRRAMHLAEALALGLDGDPPTGRPERAVQRPAAPAPTARRLVSAAAIAPLSLSAYAAARRYTPPKG